MEQRNLQKTNSKTFKIQTNLLIIKNETEIQ